ncbi:hypothetical protein [Stakelama tenebrarum]|nr:hypothetical protein [Sphingosinithalassobacter tenebrarum]
MRNLSSFPVVNTPNRKEGTSLMNKIAPVVFALIPLVAVVSACVACP